MKRIVGWFAAFSSLVLLLSCEREFTLIGDSIQPEEEQGSIFYFDEFSIKTSWRELDSIRSDKTISNLVGQYRDPVFGAAVSSFVTQLLLSSTDIDFGPNPVADSAFLNMVYYDDGLYGPNNMNMELEVYELSERLDFDSVYFSNRRFPHYSQLIGKLNFVANPDDSINIGGEPLPPMVRIDIDTTFVQKILDVSNGEELESNENFLDFINGIYVRASQGNAILKLQIPNVHSNLTFWYHTDDEDSLKFVLNLNELCQRVNMFQHSHASGQIGVRPPLGAPVEVSYLQGMSGIQTLARIEGLDTLKDKNYIVNHAELCFKLVEGTDFQFEASNRLLLARIDSNGNRGFIPDQLLEPDSYFNGYYDELTGTYCFNIGRHLHQLLNEGETNEDLTVLVSGNAVSPNRVIIHGQDAVNVADRPKLTLVLSK